MYAKIDNTKCDLPSCRYRVCDVCGNHRVGTGPAWRAICPNAKSRIRRLAKFNGQTLCEDCTEMEREHVADMAQRGAVL